MQSALRQACRSRVLPLARTSYATRPLLGQSVRTLITKKYTAEHESVTFDDTTGLGTIRITEHAQDALGDVVFVELPAVGTQVSQGDQIGAVESVKAASDIYAPVSGVIEEINEVLNEQPGLLNKSPEDKGWLCKIKLSDATEVEKLLSEEEYKETCA